MSARSIREGFLIEANGLIRVMQIALAELPQSKQPRELIEAMVRSIHSIKASASLLRASAIIEFSFELGHIFHALRRQEIDVSEEMLATLHDGLVHLLRLVNTLDPDMTVPGPTTHVLEQQQLMLRQRLMALQAPAAERPEGRVSMELLATAATGPGEPSPTVH